VSEPSDMKQNLVD